ncbi:hypothetical protein B0J12DRAFT_164270 [Macrophomina phaseolina]|uniref:Uncharacterized protein n=1 Tax=Macrophomina phaseolina TaxID=35725 RepID=A0ABQ8GRY6_9PEZI|nr:hypothetical protein B0J12DRAFT_164270 [Macrophomina phaseolina]
MSKNDWFYTVLEKERKTFEDGAYTLPSRLEKNFSRWNNLLREDETSLMKRSSARRSIRGRARILLGDVYKALGSEVLVLCTLATSVTKLATVNPKGFLPDLRKWWNKVSHPQALTNIANNLCRTYSIHTLFASSQNATPGQASHTTETPSVQMHDRSAEVQIQEVLPPRDTNQMLDASSTSENSASESGGTVLDFEFKDLLGFLQRKEAATASSEMLHMVCPWEGLPLPSIEIRLGSCAGFGAKVEFSHELSIEFIQYMLASRAGPKISN